MPALLDTMVLVYAFRPAKATDTPEWRDLRQRSAHLIATEKDFKISAISVLEFERGLKPAEQSAWAKAVARMNVAPISGAIALHAGELMRKKQGHQSTCPRCLNAKESITCKKCDAKVSVQRNLNDALIAATADLHEAIDTLYSVDGGVLAYKNFVSGARITDLPSANGPLFERGHRRQPDASEPEEPTSPDPKQSKPERP